MSLLHSDSDSNGTSAGLFPNSKEYEEWVSAVIRQGETLQTYLKSLDKHHLDLILREVLVELRGRETEQMKKDVLTHSTSLQLKNGADGSSKNGVHGVNTP